MFIPFDLEIQEHTIPKRFTFPFYYDVHPLAHIASTLVQERLENEIFGHDFGIDKAKRDGAIGKMFGVMVAQDLKGTIGYLAAFSGKLGNSNHHVGFVPPVFDLLKAQSFFRKEEIQLNELNEKIEQLLNNSAYLEQKHHIEQLKSAQTKDLMALISRNKINKENRAKIRLQIVEGGQTDFSLEALANQSKTESYELKNLKKFINRQIEIERKKLSIFENEIQMLKQKRAAHSADLQSRIFEQYTFLNAHAKKKNLIDLFDGNPPAGAGECAAPKLLQYSYLNSLKPLCMAEFWWGISPESEIRKHKQFYPSCKSKCEPILSHMLKGLKIDPNPIALAYPSKELIVIYEDEWILAINKPADYLSVPGKNAQPNILADLKQKHPQFTGPILVHRLDMSTSGILIAAKSKEIHERLQRQFELRKVKKEYVAIIEGQIESQKGVINLPLRVDLEDRPRQLVCETHGNEAITNFHVLSQNEKETRIILMPQTGRTHQLRVHCSHHLGLNCPIKGDDLYGKKADRLYLHAAKIGFYHPHSNEWMELTCPAEF